MDQATTWKEFRDACTHSRMPAENMVWVDKDRSIGYQAVGIVPRRPNWSGLVPVPGDGRYEWNGFLPIEELPHVENPEKGFFNTSNNYLIPPGWPYQDALHYLWADPYRANTIEQFLRSGRMFTVSDMMQLQNSVFSIPARELIPLLREITSPNDVTEQARQRLVHWDFNLDQDSVPAGIYEMWQRHLQENVRAAFLSEDARTVKGLRRFSGRCNCWKLQMGHLALIPLPGAMRCCLRAWMMRQPTLPSAWERT